MYATKKENSEAAATKLFQEFILLYGFPKRIMHDKGGAFNSDMFKELHRLSGIEASNTTPYHPMCNGQCERMNRSLVSMLRCLSAEEKRDWKSVLPKLSFAYNSTQHASTGFSPFFMMFGRESRLPIDEVFEEVQLDRKGQLRRRSHQQFVDEWKSSMKEVFKIAKEKSEKTQAYNKAKYDERVVREVGITDGDHVLVKNVREKGGTGKLRGIWEHQIFKVVNQQGDLPVYKVQNLDKPRDVRVLHRNHLMRCEELPLDVFKELAVSEKQDQDKSKSPRKSKGAASRETQMEDLVQEESGREGDRDDEDEYLMVVYPESERVLDTIEELGDTQEEEANEEREETREEEHPALEEVESEEETESEDEDAPSRRSTRRRTPREVLQYAELGKPSYASIS